MGVAFSFPDRCARTARFVLGPCAPTLTDGATDLVRPAAPVLRLQRRCSKDGHDEVDNLIEQVAVRDGRVWRLRTRERDSGA